MSHPTHDALLRALAQARDLNVLADLARALARESEHAMPVGLAWWLEPQGVIRQAPGALALPRALEALRTAGTAVDTERLHLRVLHADRNSGVVLVARTEGVNGASARGVLDQLASVLLPAAARLLELEALRSRVKHLEHAADVQRALFEISDLASADLPMQTMLRRIHEIVDRLIFARNFSFAR